MSTSYGFVCMNHEPGIEIVADLSAEAVDRKLQATLDAARGQQHQSCDLVIVAVSGAPIRVACLAGAEHGHRDPCWADLDVLRVMTQARRVRGFPDLTHALERMRNRCWPDDRLWRLRAVVDLEPWKT